MLTNYKKIIKIATV